MTYVGTKIKIKFFFSTNVRYFIKKKKNDNNNKIKKTN